MQPLRLFEEEDFRPTIWDPCAGFGRIPEEAAKQGLKAHATDIVDRGYSAFDGVQNFLTATRKSHCLNHLEIADAK